MDERSLAHSGHHLRPDTPEERPHACYDGYVYLGFFDDELEDEQIVPVPCRRCNSENL